MKPEPLYIQKEQARVGSMTNAELFDVLLEAVSDDANDMSGAREFAYCQLYKSIFRERLKDWLAAT